MPPPELIAPSIGSGTVVHGWGGTNPAVVCRLSLEDPAGLDLRSLGDRGVIARGLGRSYGDAAQIQGGVVLDTSRCKHFELDPQSGVLRAEAGVTIGELLHACVPAGWMVPVVPGTQHVTVGGAIASDVHGKNHAAAGTFGRHVSALGLLSATGDMLELTPEDELFQATLGGMGLTGVIVWAQLTLTRVSGPGLLVDTDRATDLERALELLREPAGSHRVAWLDLLAPRPGRGIVTRAEHVDVPPPGRLNVRSRAQVPERWPSGVLRASTVSLFNELRYRRAPRRERGRVESIGAHLFPLDVIDQWPRLYGRRGFLQYQFAVPSGSEGALMAVVEHLRGARVPCFLAVLKDLGPAAAAPLSFPIDGWTLSMDLPGSAPGLHEALDRCDEIVAEAGGRVYLTKDARMKPEALRAMYPRLDEWRAVRDSADPGGIWRSDLALRTGLLSS